MNNHNFLACGYYPNRNNVRYYSRSPDLNLEHDCSNQNSQSSMELRTHTRPSHRINFREYDVRGNFNARRVNQTKPVAHNQHGIPHVLYNHPTHYSSSNPNSYLTKKQLEKRSVIPYDEQISNYQRTEETHMNLHHDKAFCGSTILNEPSPSLPRTSHLDIYRRLPDSHNKDLSKRKRADFVGLKRINHMNKSRKTDVNEHKRKRACTQEKSKKAEELDAASILCSFSKIRPHCATQDNPRNTVQGHCMQIPACVSLDEVVPDRTKPFKSISESVSHLSDSNESGRFKCPTRLSMPDDRKELNSLHRFVRSDLLELFIQHDTGKTLQSGMSCSDSNSRVGLRCVFCAMNQPKPALIYLDDEKKSPVLDPKPIIDNFNAPMSTFYPKSLPEIYRLVCTWQRVHFNKCKNVPLSVQAMYKDLKNNDKTRGKTKYWTSSAEDLGLVNDERNGGFIRYIPKTAKRHNVHSMN